MRRLLPTISTALCVGLAVACTTDVTPPVPASTVDLRIVAPTDGVPATVFGKASGGGHIIQGEWDISFGGQVRGVGGDRDSRFGVYFWTSTDPRGQWVVQFHNVSEPVVSGGTFKSRDLETVVFGLRGTPVPVCTPGLVDITASGTFNGEPGWSLFFRGVDVGHKTRAPAYDKAFIRLYPPGSEASIYTTRTDFDAYFVECMAPGITELDVGNLKVSIVAVAP